MTDEQTSLFDEKTATCDLPRMNCTRTLNCQAEADEHHDDCPREIELKELFGF